MDVQDCIKFLHHNYTYDPDTGEFRFRIGGKVAGRTLKTHGISRRHITVFDNAMTGPRAAWLYAVGPTKSPIKCINDDPTDLRLSNLIEAGEYVLRQPGWQNCRDCSVELTEHNRSKGAKSRCTACQAEVRRKDYLSRPSGYKAKTPTGRRAYRDRFGRVCKKCKTYHLNACFPGYGNGKKKHIDGTRKLSVVCRRCNPPKIYAAWRNPTPGRIRKNVIKRSPNAEPRWADWTRIIPIYEKRNTKVKETGRAYHVDHVVPLRGMIDGVRVVSGLHWEGNLEVIDAQDNVDKGGHMWPNMPYYTEADLEALR